MVPEQRRNKLPPERVALFMLRNLETLADYPDSATQKAIDDIAPGNDRARLFDFLRRESANPTFELDGTSAVFNLVWGWLGAKSRYVKLATGKTQEEWIKLLDGERIK